MLLKLQSRTARLLSFGDEPTLRRFCTHCGPMFNRRSRVRAVVSRGSTGLVGENTSCKAHKVCISLWPTGWDDVFCSLAHRLVHTRTYDRTRAHIKSIVGIEGHFRRAVLVLTGLKYLCNTSKRKQGGLIITGGEVQWHF